MVALTDAAGTVVATHEYDAFGNHLAAIGSVVNPYRYAGYRWDAETGLYYLNARYYAPSVGRFYHPRDAFHGFEDDPASLNQYNYAHSNPVMFVDPSGYAINGVLSNPASFSLLSGISAVVVLVAPVVMPAVLVGAAIGFGYTLLNAKPKIQYPGNDVRKSPGKSWKWNSNRKQWENSKTGEVLKPDLGHKPPVGPHWDYWDKHGKRFRLFPNGEILPVKN